MPFTGNLEGLSALVAQERYGHPVDVPVSVGRGEAIWVQPGRQWRMLGRWDWPGAVGKRRTTKFCVS